MSARLYDSDISHWGQPAFQPRQQRRRTWTQLRSSAPIGVQLQQHTGHDWHPPYMESFSWWSVLNNQYNHHHHDERAQPSKKDWVVPWSSELSALRSFIVPRHCPILPFCGHTGCNHEQEADRREHFPLLIPMPHCCKQKRKHDNWMTSERGVIGTSFSFHDLSKQTPNKSISPPYNSTLSKGVGIYTNWPTLTCPLLHVSTAILQRCSLKENKLLQLCRRRAAEECVNRHHVMTVMERKMPLKM